jgi:hypothetical protein
MESLGFLDIDWKNYDYRRHLAAAKTHKPFLTVARDIESITQLSEIMNEAWHLAEFSENVVVVPKDPLLADRLDLVIPARFLLGYSVPTRYGGTRVASEGQPICLAEDRMSSVNWPRSCRSSVLTATGLRWMPASATISMVEFSAPIPWVATCDVLKIQWRTLHICGPRMRRNKERNHG